MKKFKKVVCLETLQEYWFDAADAMEAINKMKYTLDLEQRDPEAKIKVSPRNVCVWLEHSGLTYSTLID